MFLNNYIMFFFSKRYDKKDKIDKSYGSKMSFAGPKDRKED